MAKIVWDNNGERLFETGVKNAVLYPMNSSTKKYDHGYAWNGITSVTESPEGAEATALYADNIKYLNLYSAEEFKATLEAYMYPDEFAILDGTAEISPGVLIGQQKRGVFGLCYRTEIGSDLDGNNYGYKLHLLYGCQASPSEKAYSTINDSPEAITFSWSLTTTPVNVTGQTPTALLTIDSTKISDKALKTIEDKLYGTETETAELPLPDEIVTIINAAG